MIRSRALVGTVVAAVAAMAVSACAGGRIPPPAATVEDAVITQYDLATEVDTFLAVTPTARAAFEGKSPTNRIEDLNRNALAFLIQQQLIDRYAAEQGIEVDPQQLQQALQQTITRAGGRQAVDRQLEQRGLTDADVVAYQRQLAMRQAVATSLTPGGDQQARDQAFGAWLLEALGTAAIDVNPRFGALDPALGQLLPITSTAELG